ncbi:MAG TPA: MDR family MFS transporter [Chloroflexota bacterium]
MDVVPATRHSAWRPLQGRQAGMVMGSIMLTLLLEALDQTVVGTAMPRIIVTLRGFDRYTWAVTSYILASTIMLPIAGKLSDLFGRKPFLLGGTAIFLVGSLLCGAAQTIDQLIVFRTVQGLGAGIGISLVFASVVDVFADEERARWQGILGSVYGIASVIGPALGGWLSEYGPSLRPLVTDGARWRWVFFVNLPLGILALIALLLWYPGGGTARIRLNTGESMARRVDITGSVLIAAATISLLIGLTWVGEGSGMWGSIQVQATLGLATLLGVLFILTERRSPEPVLTCDLFRNCMFAANAALTFFLWMALFGMSFYVPLFLQGVLRVSPTTAGLIMTPFSLSIVLGNALAGEVIARTKRYQGVAVTGASCMTVGIALLSRMTPSIPLPSVALCAVVTGFGMGILFTATSVVVQTVLPPTQIGEGFGVVRYLGQIGGLLGLALVGTVVSVSLVGELHRQLPPVVTRQLAAEGVRFSAAPQVLVSPTFRHSALQRIVGAAAAHIQPGPHHAAHLAAAIAQETALLNHALAALRLSLALAIRQGLLTALLFCIGALLVALVMTRIPATNESVGGPDASTSSKRHTLSLRH